MTDPLDPYPGNLKQHTVVEFGRSAGKTMMKNSDGTFGMHHMTEAELKALGVDVLKPEERAPMLSDEELIRSWTGDYRPRMLPALQMMMQKMQAMDVSDFYENLITSGELVVVKTVKLVQRHPGGPPISNTEVPMVCPECGAFDVPSKTKWWKFCPGCGAKIVEG